MTIIEPNKNRIKLNLPLLILAGALAVGILLNVYLYNRTVDLKFLLNKNEAGLKELSVANAELKNSLYKIIDTNNFPELAAGLGLVKDYKPDYLEPHNPVAVISR